MYTGGPPAPQGAGGVMCNVQVNIYTYPVAAYIYQYLTKGFGRSFTHDLLDVIGFIHSPFRRKRTSSLLNIFILSCPMTGHTYVMIHLQNTT